LRDKTPYPLIFGLEINTVANLGVAVGTLLMAVVTAVMDW